jgi:circadian clock protein KaiB
VTEDQYPDETAAFERVRADSMAETYVLRLYVTGSTPRSLRAIAAVRRLCEEHLHGHYDLEVIDLYQQLQLAEGEQIIVAPTLIKTLPLPLRRITGDMSQSERVLVGLDLHRKG